MERQDVLVLGWMLLVFAVGSFVFTPLDGLVLALVLGFGFIRNIVAFYRRSSPRGRRSPVSNYNNPYQCSPPSPVDTLGRNAGVNSERGRWVTRLTQSSFEPSLWTGRKRS